LLDDWVEQLEHEGSMARRIIVANVVIQSSVGIQQRVKGTLEK
jgi:hypothetical protein